MDRLTGQKVLIIGGTSGFGLEVAKQSLQAGATVKIIGRHSGRLADALAELSQVGQLVSGTVLAADDPITLTKYLQEIGPLDHVVSMLGGAMGGGFLSSSIDEIRTTIEDKFFANLVVGRIVVPFVKDHGSITFTSGTGGHPYDASGAIIGNQAINTMVAGMAVEAAPQIRVNAVAPTWTPTGLWRNLTDQQIRGNQSNMASQIPLNRVSKPAEVASAYLFLMTNDFVTGQVINVDGGISAT